MTDENKHSWLDEASKRKIAHAIQDHLNSSNKPRKELEKCGLSMTTINKALLGDFTKKTLTRIELHLNQKFHDVSIETEEAHEDLGGYSKRSVSWIIGSYTCFRQAFDNTSNIVSYRVDVDWSNEKRGLIFSESERYDPRYTQTGMVHVSKTYQFLSLVTISSGNVRSITLNRPDSDGTCRGVISTVFNVRGALFVPVVAPIVLCKSCDMKQENFGVIARSHGMYEHYHNMLVSVTADDFALMLHGPSPNDRRIGFSVVG